MIFSSLQLLHFIKVDLLNLVILDYVPNMSHGFLTLATPFQISLTASKHAL